MKREVRDKQSKYFNDSIFLRNLDISRMSFEKQQKVRDKQCELYNRCLFYRELAKKMDKNRRLENE